MRLTDQVAIVTGAARGVGAEIARLFAAEGAMVAVADHDLAGANAVAAGIGSAALAIECDVTRRRDVDALVAACQREFGAPAIVVNAAEFTHRAQPLLALDEAHFDQLFEVNVKSLFHMAQAVVPGMRARGGGVILNIGSTAALRPRPGLTWYAASKAAVALLTRSLAAELGPDHIRVNLICPAMGETGMLGDFMGPTDTPDQRARFVASTPLGRLARPADVAQAALFLASEDAAFITGLTLPVDGGRSV